MSSPQGSTADSDRGRRQALREIDERHRKEAEGLERVAEMMKDYCQVLRGERTDLTGLGEWRIICQNLELVMGHGRRDHRSRTSKQLRAAAGEVVRGHRHQELTGMRDTLRVGLVVASVAIFTCAAVTVHQLSGQSRRLEQYRLTADRKLFVPPGHPLYPIK